MKINLITRTEARCQAFGTVGSKLMAKTIAKVRRPLPRYFYTWSILWEERQAKLYQANLDRFENSCRAAAKELLQTLTTAGVPATLGEPSHAKETIH